MSSLAIMRGSIEEIENAPIVNGQLFIETDLPRLQPPSRYNKVYIDNGNTRVKVGITDWEGIINKPFESVGDTLATAEDKLSIHTEWDRINNKPFEEIDSGLNIDTNKKLNADLVQLDCGRYDDEIFVLDCKYGYQYIEVNNAEGTISGSEYIERTITLDTEENNVIVFDGNEIGTIIDETKGVEIYSSIWNFYPKRVKIRDNICTITFPKYSTPNTEFTCRIYIKEV